MPAELMYGQKPIMRVEQTISSWAAMDWKDEMSQEEMLAAPTRQLERRPEDIEGAMEKLCATREKNKGRFDRTHRLRPAKIEEGDWVLVYNNSLDNHHKATWKFAKRWFGPYTVMSANRNGTYHLAELDGTRLAMPIKVFMKRTRTN